MTDWRMPDPVPLRTARAWALTHDGGFARTIQDYPGLDLNGLAPLDGLSIAIELEKAMLAAGCFVEQRSRRRQRVTAATAKVLKQKTAPLVEHVLRPGYADRFSPLARAYEAQRTDPAISDHDRKSVLDFLLNRLADAEREMLAARLPMEDAKGPMPSALVQAASIDPSSGELADPDGNARAGVTVNRSRLIERFPPHRREVGKQPAYRQAAHAGEHTPMLSSERLPLHAALAWIVTHDIDFTKWSATAKDYDCPAVLAEGLFLEMVEAGCFVMSEVDAIGERTKSYNFAPGYIGRLGRLALDYQNDRHRVDLRRPLGEQVNVLRSSPKALGIFEIGPISKHFPLAVMPPGDISVPDYLLLRLIIANSELCSLIGQGRIRANGVAIDGAKVHRASQIPPEAMTPSMCLDFYGVLYQEPPSDRERQEIPAWKSVTVEWGELSAACAVTSSDNHPNPQVKQIPGSKPPQSRKGGRRAQHHVPTFNSLLDHLFAQHGPLSDDDPDWKANSKVIEAVEALLKKRHPKAAVPGDTWFKGLVSDYLAAHPEQDGRKGR